MIKKTADDPFTFGDNTGQRLSKKAQLFIHIGTHKTGTTSIERVLRQYRNELRKEGLVYLPLPPEVNQFQPLKELDVEIIKSYKKNLNRQIKENQRRENRDIRFLMSYEGFSGNPLTGYNNAGIIAEHLKQITDNMDVCIIVYLRRQDNFLESMYTQEVHEGESYSFESFLENSSAFSFDWERFLSCYCDHFGRENIVVRRYDKAFLPESDSLLKDFFNILGIDIQKIVSQNNIPALNRGYSRDTLEIARLSNPYLNRVERRRLRRILQQTSSKKSFERYSYWSDDDKDRFFAQYSESNGAVAREYFNEASGLLFPYQAHNNGSQEYQGLSLEAVTAILVKAMLAENQTQTESIIVRIIAKAERKVIALLKKFPWLMSKLRNLRRKMGSGRKN
ncbi:MAG: hypothetical protein WBM44_25820 [Waterburya sp.]